VMPALTPALQIRPTIESFEDAMAVREVALASERR